MFYKYIKSLIDKGVETDKSKYLFDYWYDVYFMFKENLNPNSKDLIKSIKKETKLNDDEIEKILLTFVENSYLTPDGRLTEYRPKSRNEIKVIEKGDVSEIKKLFGLDDDTSRTKLSGKLKLLDKITLGKKIDLDKI